MPCGPSEVEERRGSSLRFRLTFWNTGGILILVLVLLVGLREGLRYTLESEMDTLLGEDVDEVRLLVERHHPDWIRIKEELDRKAVSHKARAWSARIFSAEGEVWLETIGAQELQIQPDEAPKHPFDVGSYRFLQRRLSYHGRVDDLDKMTIRVGCSRDFVDDDVLTLTKILVVATLFLLVAAPLIGYWLAGRATRPLAAILQTTARLRPGALDERVPLSGRGDELDRLSATLNGLLDRLGTHLERQRAFVANAAHELRSPLTALRTSAEVALGQDRTPEEYRELLADMIEACDGLCGLVNQLLLLAEGEAGLVGATSPVRLDSLVRRAVDMFAGVAEVRGIEVRVNAAPITVRGNDYYLRQVVHNLLDNAIKFTPPGGRVDIEVRSGSGPAGHKHEAVLRIRDTGVGIGPEDLPHVFERFYRVDKARSRDPSTPAGGNGLGLSICQAVVTAHGGQIAIASQPGQGTTVAVILPAV